MAVDIINKLPSMLLAKRLRIFLDHLPRIIILGKSEEKKIIHEFARVLRQHGALHMALTPILLVSSLVEKWPSL